MEVTPWQPLHTELMSSSDSHLLSPSKFANDLRDGSCHWLSFVTSIPILSRISISSQKSASKFYDTRLRWLCKGFEERSQSTLRKGPMRRPELMHSRCGCQDYTLLIQDGLRKRIALKSLALRRSGASCHAPRLDAVPVYSHSRRTASTTGLVSRR